jgi:hypothetical protein
MSWGILSDGIADDELKRRVKDTVLGGRLLLDDPHSRSQVKRCWECWDIVYRGGNRVPNAPVI